MLSFRKVKYVTHTRFIHVKTIEKNQLSEISTDPNKCMDIRYINVWLSKIEARQHGLNMDNKNIIVETKKLRNEILFYRIDKLKENKRSPR